MHIAGSSPGALAQGFRTVLVSEADHPFWEHWWPHGHMIGWEHTLRPRDPPPAHGDRATTRESAPHGATFEDGYRAAEVCDAIVASAQEGRRLEVAYRTL